MASAVTASTPPSSCSLTRTSTAGSALPQHEEHPDRTLRIRRRPRHQRERHDQRRRDQIRRQRQARRDGRQPPPGPACSSSSASSTASVGPIRALRASGEVVPLVTDLDEKSSARGRQPEHWRDRGDAEQAGSGADSSPGPAAPSSSPRARRPNHLTRILRGEPVGTLFLARGQTQGARKRWIGLTARPRGHLVVDAGAQGRPRDGRQEPARDRDRRRRRRVRQRAMSSASGISKGREFARGLDQLSRRSTPGQIRRLRTEQARQAGFSPLRRGDPSRQPGSDRLKNDTPHDFGSRDGTSRNSKGTLRRRPDDARDNRGGRRWATKQR